MTERRRLGKIAKVAPIAITPPPIQSQRTMGFIAMPKVAFRPLAGDEISVRYTSARNPVRTDGVPIALVALGKIFTAGA